jgi:hypothetical protein
MEGVKQALRSVVVQSDLNDRSSRQEGHSAPEPEYLTAENTEFTEFGVFFH